MSTTDYLNSLNYEQLKYCRDKCNERIRAIQAEEKKVAWVVIADGVNLDWFRTEDYPKAVACLAKEATVRWEGDDKLNPSHELNLSIKGTRLPASEYEALFSDGYWGK